MNVTRHTHTHTILKHFTSAVLCFVALLVKVEFHIEIGNNRRKLTFVHPYDHNN